jgi:hypothetical protein
MRPTTRPDACMIGRMRLCVRACARSVCLFVSLSVSVMCALGGVGQGRRWRRAARLILTHCCSLSWKKSSQSSVSMCVPSLRARTHTHRERERERETDKHTRTHTLSIHLSLSVCGRTDVLERGRQLYGAILTNTCALIDRYLSLLNEAGAASTSLTDLQVHATTRIRRHACTLMTVVGRRCTHTHTHAHTYIHTYTAAGRGVRRAVYHGRSPAPSGSLPRGTTCAPASPSRVRIQVRPWPYLSALACVYVCMCVYVHARRGA